MNRLRRPWPVLGALVLLALPRLGAQTAAAPSAAAATATSPDDVVKLSPFEVTTENDRGFQTGSVGTTARMKVNLAETPVSYSIINREFIDALGITDMGEAAAWATNQSFYSTNNGGLTNNSSQQYFQRGQVVSTGAASGTGTQRNSFQTANQINDSYNVESFDFGRGPNAALFGAGSGGGGLGGISSTQTKKARLDAPKTTVSAVYGSWNYQRFTIDYNRPLTQRLGIRINAVALNGDGWRERESFTTRGLSGTLTWRITNSTDLSLDVSHEMKQAHVVGNGYDDHASGWDGVTVFRGPITNAMFSTNATVGATSSGGSQVFGVNPITGQVGLTFSGRPPHRHDDELPQLAGHLEGRPDQPRAPLVPVRPQRRLLRPRRQRLPAPPGQWPDPAVLRHRPPDPLLHHQAGPAGRHVVPRRTRFALARAELPLHRHHRHAHDLELVQGPAADPDAAHHPEPLRRHERGHQPHALGPADI
jgi:hypothetical protein